MRCVSCAAENPDEHRFCSSCGQPLGQRCAGCGQELSASAGFCGHCGRASPASRAGLTTMPERRQTTILFCDLVGSTVLSNSMDPEELRQLIMAYHELAEAVIAEHQGFVAQYLGDGILAYFGYPQAKENDAERAVRAGLALVERARSAQQPGMDQLALRVGIATGLVVVGDITSRHTVEREIAVGSTPNLAARLQQIAAPGTVLISPTTKNLVGGHFEYEDLGLTHLRGFRQEIHLWRAVGEITGASRFEAHHSGAAIAPVIGRAEELATISRIREQVRSGHGHLLCVSGEAGIGKSRLLQAITDQEESTSFTVVRCQCDPHFQNTPLYPVVRLIERAAGVQRNEPIDDQLDRLQAWVRGDMGDASVRYLASLLSIDYSGRYAPLEESAELQREKTLGMILSQLLALAADGPVMILLEDAHWADPTSVKLLADIGAAIEQQPVLILVTGRPEFVPPWQDLRHATQLELAPLGPEDSTGVMRAVSGGRYCRRARETPSTSRSSRRRLSRHALRTARICS
jgi:class 3 adenylate cyclase